MQAVKKSGSRVLDRSYVEVRMDGKAGRLTRNEAIAAVAREMNVPSENIALIRIDGQSGSTNLVGKFYVYGSAESKKRVHPRYLEERTLTKEERQKLRQERKKPKTPAPAPEAKK